MQTNIQDTGGIVPLPKTCNECEINKLRHYRSSPNTEPRTESAAPTELSLSLIWIDRVMVEDVEVASAAIKDETFSSLLINLHRMVENRAFSEAETALDQILERFALVQAIAFANRTTP